MFQRTDRIFAEGNVSFLAPLPNTSTMPLTGSIDVTSSADEFGYPHAARIQSFHDARSLARRPWICQAVQAILDLFDIKKPGSFRSNFGVRTGAEPDWFRKALPHHKQIKRTQRR